MEAEERSKSTGQVTKCVPIGGTLPFLTSKGNLEHLGIGRVEEIGWILAHLCFYSYRQDLKIQCGVCVEL